MDRLMHHIEFRVQSNQRFDRESQPLSPILLAGEIDSQWSTNNRSGTKCEPMALEHRLTLLWRHWHFPCERKCEPIEHVPPGTLEDGRDSY